MPVICFNFLECEEIDNSKDIMVGEEFNMLLIEGLLLSKGDGELVRRELGMSLGEVEWLLLSVDNGELVGRELGMSLGKLEGLLLGMDDSKLVRRELGLSLGKLEGLSLGENNHAVDWAVVTNGEDTGTKVGLDTGLEICTGVDEGILLGSYS